jgi:hypothetical protein
MKHFQSFPLWLGILSQFNAPPRIRQGPPRDCCREYPTGIRLLDEHSRRTHPRDRGANAAWGVDLARQVGLTLIGRARGKRFIALSGEERIVYDQNLEYIEEESARGRHSGLDVS